MEIRSYELLDFERKGAQLIGHCAGYNETIQILTAGRTDHEPGQFWANVDESFEEEVQPGAFYRSLHEDDVKAVYDRNTGQVLGSTVDKTLRLFEDERGLKIIIDLGTTDFCNRLRLEVGQKKITHLLFGFETLESEWMKRQGEFALRKIKKAKLFYVSPVMSAIHGNVDIARRAFEDWKKQLAQVTPAEMFNMRKKLKEKMGNL